MNYVRGWLVFKLINITWPRSFLRNDNSFTRLGSPQLYLSRSNALFTSWKYRTNGVIIFIILFDTRNKKKTLVSDKTIGYSVILFGFSWLIKSQGKTPRILFSCFYLFLSCFRFVFRPAWYILHTRYLNRHTTLLPSTFGWWEK